MKRVLLLLIAVILAAGLSGCSITIGDTRIGTNEARETSEKTVKQAAIKQIDVSSSVGSIRMKTWDKDEIYIKATKINRGVKSRTELQEDLKNAEIIFREEGETLVIKTMLPKLKNNGMSVELEISVPKSISKYAVNSEVGDVSISDANVQLDVANNVGKIEIDGCSGIINIRAVTGDVTVESTDLKGTSSIKNNVGRIRFQGTIDKSGTYEVTNNTGEVDVTLPSDTSFEVDASTSIGDIDCEFDVSGSKGNRSVRGTVNGGGPKLVIVNNIGSVSINRR